MTTDNAELMARGKALYSEYKELKAMLEPFGQSHLLQFWDDLSLDERDQLCKQIRAIDWPNVLHWYHEVTDNAEAEAVPFERLTPAPYVELHPKDEASQKKLDAAREYGKELVRAGKVACFTVAGGQGTRLGYNGPKGTYCFSLLRNKSLFQYFAEAIARNQEKYNCVLPWYIMTSPANNAATVAFFEEHKYFGLDAANVRFFIQGTLPGFDFCGRAFLETKASLALFANGHGGTLTALRDSGTLEDMKARGIEYLTYWQVDNPMISVCDPLFIGLHAQSGSEMSSRALVKRDAMEKLGHFCLLDGRTIIIEYSDMPMDLLEKRDADGRLTFRAGSPAMHILSRSFIERITAGKLAFNPHRAQKKVEYIDFKGALVKPLKPNGTKLEFFIFDALPLAKNPLILEADRDEEFAAIKNPEGNDSPISCRHDLLERTAKWLGECGVQVPRNAAGEVDAKIEISLRRAVDPEDIAELVKKGAIPGVIAGSTICVD